MGDTGDSVSPETSWGRKTLGGGNGNPFRYSYLGNPMDRGTWWAIVLRVAESQMQVSTDAHNLAAPRDYCCSVSKSCPTLCDPMNCSIPVFLVLHYHQEFAQTHVHERMVTHSSFLAWKIPWTEETAGLWSRGSYRVRHDWACTYALSQNFLPFLQSAYFFLNYVFVYIHQYYYLIHIWFLHWIVSSTSATNVCMFI